MAVGLALALAGKDGDLMILSNEALVAVRCAECGQPVDSAQTIPALDGTGRRCANHDACEERKESQAAFTTAA